TFQEHCQAAGIRGAAGTGPRCRPSARCGTITPFGTRNSGRIIVSHLCDHETASHAVPASRRLFLKYAGVAAASLAIAPSALAQKVPPKPGNVLSPDDALARLREGNDRYVHGVSKRHDFKNEREALTTGQNPYAGILSCADSRIAPEYAF